MKTNLSSQITLNRVSPRYYRPENAFERSVLTRLEKIPTDIYESAEEGANVSVSWHWQAVTLRAMYMQTWYVCTRKRD